MVNCCTLIDICIEIYVQFHTTKILNGIQICDHFFTFPQTYICIQISQELAHMIRATTSDISSYAISYPIINQMEGEMPYLPEGKTTFINVGREEMSQRAQTATSAPEIWPTLHLHDVTGRFTAVL